MDNPLALVDLYKPSHWKQTPPDMEYAHSYFEGRNEFRLIGDDIVFVGLQYLLRKYYSGNIVSPPHIDEAEEIVTAAMGPGVFNRAGWMHILHQHHGHLPLRVWAVPEGGVYKPHQTLYALENTCPRDHWLPQYLETTLDKVWAPTTVASIARAFRLDFQKFADQTCDNAEHVPWQLHNFGDRGASSVESAAVTGMGHLVAFKGTDNANALKLIHEHYDEPYANIGGSVPAMEHSTVMAWTKWNEVDAYRNMLEQFPTGTIACVSDTYDIMNAVKNYWGRDLKDQVMERAGVVVIRPDSGDVVRTPIQVIEALAEAFGTVTNSKGFKVLDPHVSVIQGDGVKLQTPLALMLELVRREYATSNLYMGMGGGLSQEINRDMYGFTQKQGAVKRGGMWLATMKEAPGKPSRPGRHEHDDGMRLIWEDGWFTYEGRQSWSQVRSKAGV